jgi:hypothetical protein
VGADGKEIALACIMFGEYEKKESKTVFAPQLNLRVRLEDNFINACICEIGTDFLKIIRTRIPSVACTIKSVLMPLMLQVPVVEHRASNH